MSAIIDYANRSSAAAGVYTLRVQSVDYAPTVATLTGASNSLAAITTVGRALLSVMKIVIGGYESEWQLKSGAANATYPSDQVAPNDYSVVSNNVHWEKVIGL